MRITDERALRMNLFYLCAARRVDTLQYCLIAVCALVFVGALFHYGKRVWQCMKQNDNEENRPLLNERQEEVVDYAANHSNDFNAAARNARNNQNRVAATTC